MDLDVFVDYLLDNGLYKTAHELLSELEGAGESPPAKLVGFFGKTDSTSLKSADDVDPRDDCGTPRLSSEQLALYDVLSQIAPESKAETEEESKALLRYKLRLAHEEIDRLKSTTVSSQLSTNTTVCNKTSNRNVDQLVMKYLEGRGLEYSASTLCDEANLDPSRDPQPTLVELVQAAISGDTNVSSLGIEKQLADKSKQLEDKSKQLETARVELRSAHSEIERFSQNLVQNMLTVDTINLIVPTLPVLSSESKGNVVQVSERIWQLAKDGCRLNASVDANVIACDMPNLIGVIEDCIEPLLSGILLKHRPLLIPLLLSAGYLATSPESNDTFLKKLFNLIKKPDEDQRELISVGCAAYAKHCGDGRCEAELLPQLWLQLDHKHMERRLLVAETAASLAMETGPQTHPLLLSICQQLLEDKDAEVRCAAANSFAVLLAFCRDEDRLSSLQKTAVSVVNDDSIPLQTGLLILSIIGQLSFQAEKEGELLHKLLKLVETEQDTKRGLRAVAEILPHFYVSMVSSLNPPVIDDSQSPDSLHLPELSKWNQISSISNELNQTGLAQFEWNTNDESHSRFNVLSTFLSKQVIPRLVDCALECPMMPDFCEIWVLIFGTISTLFGPKFARVHIHPLMISELGLFTDSEEKSALQTILVTCFCAGSIATLIEGQYMFQYFSMVLREVLFKIKPTQMTGFELLIESLLDRKWKSEHVIKRVNEATIGVLWEGVTHDVEDIRKITARAITCAARKLLLSDISRQLFPALNSLCFDTSHVIRKEATNCVAVVVQRTQLERHEDLEKRLQKIVMQLLVDPYVDVKTSVIKALVPIALDSGQTYREDFFLPQVAMVVTNIMPASVDPALVETVLDLYDQLLRSNCALTNGCIISNVIPALDSLEPICKTKVFHRSIQLKSLIRTATARVEPKQEFQIPTSKSAYSLSSVLRNPFSKR